MKRKSLYNFCINDIILAAAIIAITAALFTAFSVIKGKTSGNTVRITVAGSLYGQYSLSNNQTIDISNGNGNNTVIIENGEVRMENADCPDKYCVSSGNIEKYGESIVCLPHKLVVDIVQGDESPDDGFDAVAQ